MSPDAAWIGRGYFLVTPYGPGWLAAFTLLDPFMLTRHIHIAPDPYDALYHCVAAVREANKHLLHVSTTA